MTKKICYAPFRNIEIRDEKVHPCCPQWCNFYSFGNLVTMEYDEIWNSKNAQIMREMILNNDYSICNKEVCPVLFNENFEPVDGDTSIKPIMERYPDSITLAYDWDCNIACSFCRKDVYRNSKEKIEKYNSRISKIVSLLNSGISECKYIGGGKKGTD